MKTVSINIYKYDELSDKAKEKAIECLSDINVDFGWWDSEYAKNIGLELTEFDLDRNRHAKGRFLDSAEYCASQIIKEHGKTCETYKTAKAYLKEIKEIETKHADKESDNGLTYAGDQAIEQANEDFLKSILEDYSIMLQKQNEYLQSREAIEESIRCNEYDFSVAGDFPAF
jgi:hypothetical protein